MYELFLRESVRRIEQLEVAINEDDLDAVLRIAHSLKGSSANVGAHALAALGDRLYNDVKESVSADLSVLLEQLKLCFHRTQQAVLDEVLLRSSPTEPQ